MEAKPPGEALRYVQSDGDSLSLSDGMFKVEPCRASPVQLHQHELAGKPLKTLEIMLGYIRGTSTATGLKVKAFLDRGVYKRGQKVKSEDLERLKTEPHVVFPKWNYTMYPRKVQEEGTGVIRGRVSVDTIRFYQKLGLIKGVGRSSGG